MPNRLRARLLAATLVLAACGPTRRSSTTPPATIVFTNDSADLAEVYAVRSSGGAIRSGTGEAGRTTQLRVPATALGGDGTVTFTARIFARPRVTPSSGPVPLREGESVAVRLSADLRMLSVLPVRQP